MNTNFFAELIARLGKSNPKFFDYIQIAALGLGALSAGFKFLDDHNGVLPEWLSWIKSWSVLVSSGVAFVLAQLPNKDVNEPTKK